MGKIKSSSSKHGTSRYLGVTKAVQNGRFGFQASFTAPGNGTHDLGFFTAAVEAAKAVDRATLAAGRKGPLNLNRMNYNKKDIDREKERLIELGVISLAPAQSQQAGAKKRGKAKRKGQQPQQQLHAPEQVPEGPAAGPDTVRARDSRKRKAASDSPDAAAAAASKVQRVQHDDTTTAAAAPEQGRPKRRKVQHQHSGSPGAARPAPMPDASGHQHDTAPKAAAAGPKAAAAAASTALVLAAPSLPAPVQPTGTAVQLGPSTNGAVSQELMLSQLRSALAAHEASKQQLRAALTALEVSEGQLAAVARAAGLQLC